MKISYNIKHITFNVMKSYIKEVMELIEYIYHLSLILSNHKAVSRLITCASVHDKMFEYFELSGGIRWKKHFY